MKHWGTATIVLGVVIWIAGVFLLVNGDDAGRLVGGMGGGIAGLGWMLRIAATTLGGT